VPTAAHSENGDRGSRRGATSHVGFLSSGIAGRDRSGRHRHRR
jgi:hypothetical protein